MKKKEKKTKKKKTKKCVICETPTNHNNYCSGHQQAERNCKNNPNSEKHQKLWQEVQAYSQAYWKKKKEDKAAAIEKGPTCANPDCRETDQAKFSEHPTTKNGWGALCNKCRTAKYNICHKHTEKYGRKYYNSFCMRKRTLATDSSSGKRRKIS